MQNGTVAEEGVIVLSGGLVGKETAQRSDTVTTEG